MLQTKAKMITRLATRAKRSGSLRYRHPSSIVAKASYIAGDLDSPEKLLAPYRQRRKGSVTIRQAFKVVTKSFWRKIKMCWKSLVNSNFGVALATLSCRR